MIHNLLCKCNKKNLKANAFGKKVLEANYHTSGFVSFLILNFFLFALLIKSQKIQYKNVYFFAILHLFSLSFHKKDIKSIKMSSRIELLQFGFEKVFNLCLL